jgi:hypothetical protein
LFLFFLPLYCLSFVPFLMAIVLFIICSFSYGHCIVCSSSSNFPFSIEVELELFCSDKIVRKHSKLSWMRQKICL